MKQKGFDSNKTDGASFLLFFFIQLLQKIKIKLQKQCLAKYLFVDAFRFKKNLLPPALSSLLFFNQTNLPSKATVIMVVHNRCSVASKQ